MTPLLWLLVGWSLGFIVGNRYRYSYLKRQAYKRVLDRYQRYITPDTKPRILDDD